LDFQFFIQVILIKIFSQDSSIGSIFADNTIRRCALDFSNLIDILDYISKAIFWSFKFTDNFNDSPITLVKFIQGILNIKCTSLIKSITVN